MGQCLDSRVALELSWSESNIYLQNCNRDFLLRATMQSFFWHVILVLKSPASTKWRLFVSFCFSIVKNWVKRERERLWKVFKTTVTEIDFLPFQLFKVPPKSVLESRYLIFNFECIAFWLRKKKYCCCLFSNGSNEKSQIFKLWPAKSHEDLK